MDPDDRFDLTEWFGEDAELQRWLDERPDEVA